MVSKTRAVRIAERIREDLTELLLNQVDDPRLIGVTITDVTVDRELAYADIYVSALEGAQREKEILEGFEHAHGYLRSELARRIELRRFPKLRFHWDATFERAEKIDRLIAKIQSGKLGQSQTIEDSNTKI